MKKFMICLWLLCLLCSCSGPADAQRPPVDPVIPGQEAADPNNTPAVPDGPADAPTVLQENVCSLTIRCDKLIGNPDLDPEKVELIPSDGLLCSFEQVAFEPGESVFNILQRTLKQNKKHLEFSTTPLYNTAYIEGICNLYQFDAGSLSGWMYSVNGQFPLIGCSNTLLQPGDVVEWHFTCDLGADLGVEGFTGYVD